MKKFKIAFLLSLYLPLMALADCTSLIQANATHWDDVESDASLYIDSATTGVLTVGSNVNQVTLTCTSQDSSLFSMSASQTTPPISLSGGGSVSYNSGNLRLTGTVDNAKTTLNFCVISPNNSDCQQRKHKK
jgi:hypothetical protein